MPAHPRLSYTLLAFPARMDLEGRGGKGQGHPRKASVPSSGKGGAILGEDRGLTGLWPPDPPLAILSGNGEAVGAVTRAAELSGSLWERGLCKGGLA